MNTLIIIAISIIVGFIILYAIDKYIGIRTAKLKRSKLESQEGLVLYKDYVIAFDKDDTDGRPLFRAVICIIRKVMDDVHIKVSIPSCKIQETIITWVPHKNNFYTEGGLDRLQDLGQLTPEAVSER